MRARWNPGEEVATSQKSGRKIGRGDITARPEHDVKLLTAP